MNARGVKVSLFAINFSAPALGRHFPFYGILGDFVCAWWKYFWAVKLDAAMKLFSRSKPSTSVDEQPQQGSGEMVQEKMMNNDERSQSPPSPSTTRTSPFQSDRLGRQSIKLANVISSPDFEKQPTCDEPMIMEHDEYEMEDTDVWYTEESVECVLGAFWSVSIGTNGVPWYCKGKVASDKAWL